MKLIANWKETLTGAWSVRLLILAAVLSVLPIFVSLVSPDLLGLDPLVFAAIAALVNLAAIPARVLVQPASGLWFRFRRDDSGAVRKKTLGLLAGGGVALASAVSFIGQWEGLRTEAYRDIIGIWTVCYGETRGVQPGDSYSTADCDAMLAREIVAFEAQLDRCLTAPVPVGVKVALVSWTYNVGAGAACRSTLVRRANAGDLAGACHQLPRWNRAGGRVIRGLTNRRMSERAMCLRALEAA
ncbi:lysozyme [Phaeobacter sp. B1627]|uniref:lysozyme n=1 Tax=Phaeobacter sp. B1627 TaxID=2583809 RepID=UPI0011195DE2|nr:lysozyme [Phaeobacter sp. B1627]TNJ39064.1 lysozyme [Phaeobacter sp. B1627]